MAELILSPQADEDLDQIWSYIAKDHPANADTFIDKLYNKRAPIKLGHNCIGCQ